VAFDGYRSDPKPKKRPMVFGVLPNKEPAPPPTITLLTDFGTDDVYVGVMKGVIKRAALTADVIDLTHAVAPQDVVQGAFLLQQAWRYFPAGTVHLVVVDPGVGTSRRRLALQYEGHYFVGPDNGVLSAALPDAARGLRGAGDAYVASEVDVPEGVRVFAGDGGASAGVSATFEGRDVFAPAAAFLANGGDISRIGRPVERMLALPAFRAPALQGVVLHVDRYGNLVTDIRGDDVPAGAGFEVAGRRVRLVRTYGDSSEVCALVGSAGFVEVAMPGGSAAAVLGLGKGALVKAVAS
jgi:S-adenosyl-L-methionine hydrolase (adenosine-forming)